MAAPEIEKPGGESEKEVVAEQPQAAEQAPPAEVGAEQPSSAPPPPSQQIPAGGTVSQAPSGQTAVDDTAQAVQVPADEETLHKLAHGDPADARTWWAVVWERVVRQALQFGKRVFFGGRQQDVNQ